MSSSIPGAMRFLYDGIKALPECAEPVKVTVGFPVRADKQVSIGVEPDDDETESEMIRGDLAAKADRESPVVPCAIRVRKVAGDQSAATLAAIDEAFAIFSAIHAFVRKDGTLGRNVSGNAWVADYRMRLTNSAGQAGEGRVCRIYFSISWSHFL